MTTQPIDPQESQRIASAINDLLVEHGYPRERINEWWNDDAYPQLGGRTPTRAWDDGAYDDVLSLIEQSYAASERAAKQLVDDSERFSRLRQRVAQLTDTYA